MGKHGHGHRKKKSFSGIVPGDLNSESLKRAHELKEEGNRRFQAKDYSGALQHYENALQVSPKTHPDRALFHSNKAACLMQMNPIDYDSVIAECTLALQIQPQFVRALLRRARAFEAVGNYDMSMKDVQAILNADPKHIAASEIAARLRHLQDSQPSAAVGASAVRGGTNLPARQVHKPETKNHSSKVGLKSKANTESSKEQADVVPFEEEAVSMDTRWRPLKLVYDQDIRVAQMPVNCKFKVLREVVSKRFPMSKAVLIKYKDIDGDLVTITCTSELRLAESCADTRVPKNSGKRDSIGKLRLHIVEVSPEQEPPLLEEVEKNPLENKIDNTEKNGSMVKSEHKQVEVDDWLIEFAQLFRNHVGIDPDAHVDLHELGMELYSEALEETVTSEDAQIHFDKAALKFQEVAALAFLNCGNVHMCAARKRFAIDESAAKEMMVPQLKAAYDWVREKYSLAQKYYEEALTIKPDFYEGLLALGQQQFEIAKLHWSFVLAKKEDLSKWDSTETMSLFDSAEEKLKLGTEMWEKLEERKANELKDPPSAGKKDEILKRTMKQGNGPVGESLNICEISHEEAAEQAAVMKSQIHIFWGNMLFERSQIECRLGLPGWKKNLNHAEEWFKLAGASETDILTVLKNHFSNEAAKEHEKKG